MLTAVNLMPGLVQVAEQQGRYMARCLNNSVNGQADTCPEPFVYRSRGRYRAEDCHDVLHAVTISHQLRMPVTPQLGQPRWVHWCNGA